MTPLALKILAYIAIAQRKSFTIREHIPLGIPNEMIMQAALDQMLADELVVYERPKGFQHRFYRITDAGRHLLENQHRGRTPSRTFVNSMMPRSGPGDLPRMSVPHRLQEVRT